MEYILIEWLVWPKFVNALKIKFRFQVYCYKYAMTEPISTVLKMLFRIINY